LNRIVLLLITLCALLLPLPGLYAQAGGLDATFDPNVAGSFVIDTALQPDGKIIIVGTFQTVGSVPRNRLARLNADGTVDATFNPGTGADGEVDRVVLQADGKILIGGFFGTVNGQTRNRFARLNANGSVESTETFDVGTGANGNVTSIAVQPDGRILIAGGFSLVNGQTRRGIVRLETNGSVDATFDVGNGAQSGSVLDMAVQPDGKIVLGGSFRLLNGQSIQCLGRLTTSGTVESTFNPQPNEFVQSVVVQPDGKILFSGVFTSVGGQARSRIARLQPNGTLEGTGTFNTTIDFATQTMALQTDGKVLIGGTFTTVNGLSRMRITRLNIGGSVDPTFSPNAGAGGTVNNVAVQADGRVILGGSFITVNGTTRNRMARLVNDAAIQSLGIPDPTQIRWQRSGAAPEVSQVTFELSVNGGVSWTPLGVGTRIFGGWQLTGLNLPSSGSVRARGRCMPASSIVEQVQGYLFDITPPALSAVTISSNNANPLYAKSGDVVTLAFISDEPIQPPVVTIAGQTVTVTNASGNNWQGTLTVGAQSAQGPVAFSMTATDLAGNAAAPVTATTNGTSVTIDRIPPELTLLGANLLIVQMGAAYVEPGATASDAQAGNLTASIQISGAVNTHVIGTYVRTYFVADNAGNTATATRTVRVVDVPVAGTDTLGTMKNTPVSAPAVKLLANDSDPNGHPLSLVSVSLTSSNGGTVALNSGLLTYAPPAGFVGLDSFTYAISNGLGGMATGTVNVTVSGTDAASLNLVSMTRTADGFLVSFAGIPGDSYLIQFTDNLTPPVAWQTLTPPGPIQAGPNGLFQFEDKPNPIPPQRFYRAAIPQ
jgi:uncharacterized delta-60 repeat protein